MDPVKARETLLAAPFTAAEAERHGLDYSQLLQENVRHISRELYVPDDNTAQLRDRVRAHLAVTPQAWASHQTAAALHGLWLPDDAADHSLLHLSKPTDVPRVRRTGVVGHRVRVKAGEIVELSAGVRVSSPARTWLDLGNELGPVGLVILGDELLRIPRPGLEGRAVPHATKGALAALLRAHPNMPGVAKCRAALADMRVGADSPQETLLRLSLLAHGFPEPELQIALRPNDPFSPSADMGYPSVKVAIQYDGSHHLSEEQRWRDARRDAAFRAAGWIVLIVRSEDCQNDFASVRAALRGHLAGRAA
ncbi:hypothetical protein SA2016_3159 [Sinomonas atrocyanea]|uniref:DUF559 domain-containing protein n=1 Tax=Sinomonas atrocyanea TaxID=37927 RepID=A0A127A3E5_9MICC|nr:hypothetical protein [Sinomonas atrocyanea]AMM33823.1 hypothetical protein SA2016_3159 [Sinomonas atrocyanea]GEB64397.1 hypothetical protein SAT01_18450 [Sinomonas atrocyanea]GGG68940.1 hypothetical protein GCM10007172_21190 [Sinomonas atrocyanea]